MTLNALNWFSAITRRLRLAPHLSIRWHKDGGETASTWRKMRQKTGSISEFSILDKQRICVNTQLKSSKKQLKWNVYVPKSNSNDRYAITCDVIAYHLVHFVSIWVIDKCQSGIDFFLLASAQYNFSFINISVPSPVFRGKNTTMKVKLCKMYMLECQQGDEICIRYNKFRCLIL